MYIYSLSDPLSGHVKYIGCTADLKKRLSSHIYSDKDQVSKKRWIHSLTKTGHLPTMDVVDVVDDSEWAFWERHYISLFKSWGFRLLNVSIGGSGASGITHSASSIKKISDASKRLWGSKEYSKMMCEKARGLNNAFADKNKYSFWHPIHGEQHTTMYELRIKYNLDDSKVCQVVNGKRFEHKKWKLLRNKYKLHNNEDGNIYTWVHPIFGERKVWKKDLMAEFKDLLQANLCKVIKGVQKSHKGWTIVKP